MGEFAEPLAPRGEWDLVRTGVFRWVARTRAEARPFTVTAMNEGRIRSRRVRPPRRYYVTLGPFLTRGRAMAAVRHITGG